MGAHSFPRPFPRPFRVTPFDSPTDSGGVGHVPAGINSPESWIGLCVRVHFSLPVGCWGGGRRPLLTLRNDSPDAAHAERVGAQRVVPRVVLAVHHLDVAARVRGTMTEAAAAAASAAPSSSRSKRPCEQFFIFCVFFSFFRTN